VGRVKMLKKLFGLLVIVLSVLVYGGTLYMALKASNHDILDLFLTAFWVYGYATALYFFTSSDKIKDFFNL
jgi:hypothetical protein